MEAAVQFHQQGDWDRAGTLYAQVLRAAPDNADAWHLSGVMALQLGRAQQAVEQISFALQLAPRNVDAWSNLGLFRF